ncbi:MAG: 4Fe-4S dicluster domain-containing protein [Deltaproteobacteria bacterium]|nr:4Fe-4S dicluster domain-containing protein [Deltaproteobacteria bacterium]
MFRLSGNPAEKDFVNRVMEMSGQNLLECLQCGKCSGSCPVASEQVRGPRMLVAEILSGMKHQALTDSTWWYCVACGTCMTRCPVEINMYRVATALCELAQEAGIPPCEPEIHLFEDLFLKSVEKYGRVRELRTVATYNIRTKKPLKDFDKGMTLIGKGAISPLDILRRWKKDAAVSRIFAKTKGIGHGE